MKELLLCVVDVCIWVLTFLFLISSFFKIISWSIVDKLVYNNEIILVGVWALGVIIAIILTPHLYRWILHFRYR